MYIKIHDATSTAGQKVVVGSCDLVFGSLHSLRLVAVMEQKNMSSQKTVPLIKYCRDVWRYSFPPNIKMLFYHRLHESLSRKFDGWRWHSLWK